MELRHVADEEHRVARLYAEGGLSQDGQSKNGDPIEAVLGPDAYRSKVLLGLQKADYVSSTGIGWLLASHKKFRESGGVLVIHSIPDIVSQTLKMMRLDMLLNLARDEDAALALAEGNPSHE